jgi:hypothetical protein
MIVIPTYVVTIKVKNPWREWRVPETELASFLRLLVFNNVTHFEVKLEDEA